MSSSGVMWSQDNKEGLLRHLPQAALFDSFGSSEAVGMGASVSTAGGASQTARFQIGPSCAVFTEDGHRVEPGSGERGLVAVGGFIPLGYYKDEEKTARTFRVINGVRYAIPGDWCVVEPDGSLTLLGRGSACINTAGEKVFPEEVEEALKTHPDVEDALVVGLPDPKWGQAVTGVVRLYPDRAFDETALVEGLAADRPRVAILDVFREEPLPADNPLWDHPKVRVSAHASSFGSGTITRGDQLFLDNLARYLKGGALINEVSAGSF
jgi:fatty-acyl-CoA synthase